MQCALQTPLDSSIRNKFKKKKQLMRTSGIDCLVSASTQEFSTHAGSGLKKVVLNIPIKNVTVIGQMD